MFQSHEVRPNSRKWIWALFVALSMSFPAMAAQLFVPIPATGEAASAAEQNPVVKQIRERKTTKSVTQVRINLDALKDNTVDLNLRADVSSKATMKKVDKRSEKDFTWYGQLADVPGDAILVVKDGALEGTVRRGDSLYKIQSVGGGVHSVIEIDQSKFPPEEPPSFKNIERKINQLEPAIKIAADKAPLADNPQLPPPVVEVLVAYTGSVETAKGGASNTSAMIQLAVDETNQGYVNSKVNVKLHLAKVVKVSYSEAGKTFDKILADFAGNGDGFMDEIHGLRNSSAADVAVLIINQSDFCGLADAIKATAATAFVTVYYDCATGYYSFAHEIGHLQGARHNVEADATTTPFAYGHGFHSGSAWRTIMAYDCTPSCPRLQYWSSPLVKYNNVAMGTAAKQDNARVLNATAGTVAAFRSPGPSPQHNACINHCTLEGGTCMHNAHSSGERQQCIAEMKECKQDCPP